MSNLARAIAKVKYYPTLNNEWGGYLTPSEIVAIVAAGAKPVRGDDLNRAMDKVAAGTSGGTWFYFHPNLALNSQLEAKKDNKKVGTRDKL